MRILYSFPGLSLCDPILALRKLLSDYIGYLLCVVRSLRHQEALVRR